MSDDRLADLRWHWGEAYYITHPGDDTWVAFPRRGGVVLVAETAADLRVKIRRDYDAATVPQPA